MRTGWTNAACNLGNVLKNANLVVHFSEKYVGKREGVMEEMEIVAAGLQTVRL